MFVRHPCIAVVPYAYASDAPSDESFVVTGCDKYAPMTTNRSINLSRFARLSSTPRVADATSTSTTKDGARVAASSARRRVTYAGADDDE